MATIAERVSAGIAWLDENVGPEWPGRIELKEFKLSDACRCVLGFVFACECNSFELYLDGKKMGYYAAKRVHDLTHADCARLGFDVPKEVYAIGKSGVEFAALQAEWTRRLTEREQPVTTKPIEIPVEAMTAAAT